MTSDWSRVAEELSLGFGAPKLSARPSLRTRSRSLLHIDLFGRSDVRRDHDLLSHVVQDRAITDADCMALRCGLLALSYRDLHAAMLEATKRLHGLGVRKGDRIIVFAESGFQVIALVLALSELEARILLAHARAGLSELEGIRDQNAKFRLIYCAGDSSAAADHAKLEPVRAEFDLFGPVIVQELAQVPNFVRVRRSTEQSTISFSEGGFCAAFRHRRLLENASYLAGACALTARDVIYNCATVAGIEGFLITLTALHAGAGAELVTEPDPEHFVWRLNEGRVSCLVASPSFFRAILAYAELNGHVLRSRPLRLISSARESLDPDLEKSILAAFGKRVYCLG